MCINGLFFLQKMPTNNATLIKWINTRKWWVDRRITLRTCRILAGPISKASISLSLSLILHEFQSHSFINSMPPHWQAGKQIHGCSLSLSLSLSVVLQGRTKQAREGGREGKWKNRPAAFALRSEENRGEQWISTRQFHQPTHSTPTDNQPAAFNSKWTENDVCMDGEREYTQYGL